MEWSLDSKSNSQWVPLPNEPHDSRVLHLRRLSKNPFGLFHVSSCPPGWRYFSCGKYGKMLIIWWLFNFNRAWWLGKSGWNGQTNLRICGVFKTSRYMFPPFKDSSANQNPGTSSKQNIGSWPIIYFMGIWRADDRTKDNIIYPTKSNLIGRVPKRGC